MAADYRPQRAAHGPGGHGGGRGCARLRGGGGVHSRLPRGRPGPRLAAAPGAARPLAGSGGGGRRGGGRGGGAGLRGGDGGGAAGRVQVGAGRAARGAPLGARGPAGAARRRAGRGPRAAALTVLRPRRGCNHRLPPAGIGHEGSGLARCLHRPGPGTVGVVAEMLHHFKPGEGLPGQKHF